MLAKRIVACLDVCGGRVVKGTRFRNLRDAGEPVARARRYCEQGADEIVVLDVSATREERLASLQTIEQVARAIDVPLTVGGGVGSVADFARVLDAGADKVAVNSAAIADPALLSIASRRFGRQCVVLSIDAIWSGGRYELATRSATRHVPRDAIAWAAAGERLGAGEILLTSIDRDGTQQGFDVRLVAAVVRTVGLPVIASGGGSTAESFVATLEAGADAALGASSFHNGALSVQEVKLRCRERGMRVRP